MWLFAKPAYEKYTLLINRLQDYYSPLSIIEATSSHVILEAQKSRNIENVKIFICKGLCYNEHPIEYKNLNYSKVVLVKMTYSINEEVITIRMAFPKDGNQHLMFLSIFGAELSKTNYVIKQQHKREEELRKRIIEEQRQKEEEKRRRLQEIERLRQIRNDIENNKQKALTDKQKVALIQYLCYLTDNSIENKNRYCRIFNLNIAKAPAIVGFDFLNSYYRSLYRAELNSIRNKSAVYNFILWGSYRLHYPIVFTEILLGWGFYREEVSSFIENPSIREIRVQYTIDDIKNFNLTFEQKTALLGVATSFPFKENSSSLIKRSIILHHFSQLFEIDVWNSNSIFSYQSTEDINKYIEILHSIKKDEPLIQLINIYKDIMEVDDNNTFIEKYFIAVLRRIGFSQEEIAHINRGIYIYKYSKDKQVSLKG